jgi:hypothetical protein
MYMIVALLADFAFMKKKTVSALPQWDLLGCAGGLKMQGVQVLQGLPAALLSGRGFCLHAK